MENNTTVLNLPILPLRGLVVFPRMSLNFDIERALSVAALEHAMAGDQMVFLVMQKDGSVETPRSKDLYSIGTVARITQLLRTGRESVRVIAEVEHRGRLRRLWQNDPYLQGNVELIPAQEFSEAYRRSPRSEALLRQTYQLFTEYANLAGSMASELIGTVVNTQDVGYLADLITQNITLRPDEKQDVLEELSAYPRLRKVNSMLARECSVLELEHEMDGKVREQLARYQREQILRTQLHVLQNELGEETGNPYAPQMGAGDDEELAQYQKSIEALSIGKEVKDHLLRELGKLSKQPFGSAEAALLRNYLDVCLELPWGKETTERVSVEAARKVLERDHYGLEKVKQRILETIAVRAVNPEGKGQILCLVGPPGVGKTSIAISVAKALNRKLARLSLGGVRDEADIRGHRKTYIGAMPGRIITALSQCGSMNPLMLLDEVDKMGTDYRGDPAAALLEVLDSEQNGAFRDHFIELPVDLSHVMFITTANTTETIPRPLLDRMELIQIPSYTDEEKLQIARRHLLPKQLKEHGLRKTALRIDDDTLRAVIRDYTRESGVRQLERRIAALCRKTDMLLVSGEGKHLTATEETLPKLFDTPPFPPDLHTEREEIGVVNGLAWTEYGGEILEVEVNVMDGSGKVEITGNLGTVMKESVQAALSCIRSRSAVLGVAADFYEKKDIHIHFPAGAVPKDGPSAGIAVATAMLSALTDRPVRAGIAMTGEITLRGRVLAIGGLREKSMAALRSGIRTILIPHDNLRDENELDPAVKEAVQFIPVKTVDEVFSYALLPRTPVLQEVLPAGDAGEEKKPKRRTSKRSAALRQ